MFLRDWKAGIARARTLANRLQCRIPPAWLARSSLCAVLFHAVILSKTTGTKALAIV
ncbi:MAG: hypothetical protein V4808_16500 [Pseudomonadota bacterium]